MYDARLQAELAESQAEILRLRERMTMGMPTVHKDLSLISLLPRWLGLESAIPREDVFCKHRNSSPNRTVGTSG
jgi:hypothetical protein